MRANKTSWAGTHLKDFGKIEQKNSKGGKKELELGRYYFVMFLTEK